MPGAPSVPSQLYIGNLAAGMVTADALRQVFDSALMAAYPEVGAAGWCATAAGLVRLRDLAVLGPSCIIAQQPRFVLL
jgi:hypothetical protein